MYILTSFKTKVGYLRKNLPSLWFSQAMALGVHGTRRARHVLPEEKIRVERAWNFYRASKWFGKSSGTYIYNGKKEGFKVFSKYIQGIGGYRYVPSFWEFKLMFELSKRLFDDFGG